MLAAGTHRARAISGTPCKASTGTEQVAVVFRVPTEEGDQTITWFGFCTDKTWHHTVRSLRACGWQGDDITDLTGIDANDVDLVIEHEEYDGKMQARVRFVNEVGAAPNITPMDEDSKRLFAARMRGLMAAGAGKPTAKAKAKPAPKARQSPAEEPSPFNDDVPF